MEDIAFAELIKQKGRRLFFAFARFVDLDPHVQKPPPIVGGVFQKSGHAPENPGVPGNGCRRSAIDRHRWDAVILPVWAWLDRSGLHTGFSPLPTTIMACLAVSALAMMYLATLRELRVPFPYVLGLPIGFTVLSALIVNSLIRHRKGDKRWKGRTYS